MKLLKWFLLLAGVSMFAEVPLLMADQWNEVASGRVYVQGDNTTDKVRIPVPAGISWDLLELYSQEVPNGAGNSVVGFYDFKMAKTAAIVSPTDDIRYVQYPCAGFIYDSSWRGKSGFFTGTAPSPDIYVGNTPTAGFGIGQWIEWIASQQTHN